MIPTDRGTKVLLRFRVANFASLRDEQELSLVALDEHDDLAVRRPLSEDVAVLPAAAIFGGNASGKSNLLEALRFVAFAVANSHQRWKPGAPIARNAFRFDESVGDRPSEFCVDVALDGMHYEYGFSVDDQTVRSEWLYGFTRRQRRVRRVLFERSGPGGDTIRFSEHLKGQKKAIAELVRPNSLYLSAAAANNHPQLTRLYEWFERELIYVDAGNPLLHLNQTLHAISAGDRESVMSLLNYADLGITDVRHETRPMDREIRERLIAFMRAMDPEAPIPDENSEVLGPPKVDFVHRVGGKEYSLPLSFESSGTVSWFALLGPIMHALQKGKLLVVDELNAYLHPLLASELVRLFQEPQFNRKGAQIVFNAHDVTLLSKLSGGRLRRDQIWLTDRGVDGATELRPLTQYRIRDGLDNVFRGYLLGRYQGVPIFDDFLLAEALTRQTESHVAPKPPQQQAS